MITKKILFLVIEQEIFPLPPLFLLHFSSLPLIQQLTIIWYQVCSQIPFLNRKPLSSLHFTSLHFFFSKKDFCQLILTILKNQNIASLNCHKKFPFLFFFLFPFLFFLFLSFFETTSIVCTLNVCQIYSSIHPSTLAMQNKKGKFSFCYNDKEFFFSFFSVLIFIAVNEQIIFFWIFDKKKFKMKFSNINIRL